MIVAYFLGYPVTGRTPSVTRSCGEKVNRSQCCTRYNEDDEMGFGCDDIVLTHHHILGRLKIKLGLYRPTYM